MYDGCWHCAAPKTHIAHVIGHRERVLFRELQAKGQLGIASVDQQENAMPLCPQCQDAFDESSTLGWVFVPTDLKFFLDFEREDFERRTEALKTTGSRSGRICPSSLQYQVHQEQELERGVCGGLYMSYVLRHYFYRLEGYPEIKPGASPFINNPKSWHGDPMASLEKAFKASGQQPNVFPQEVKSTLRELLDLYCENDKLSVDVLRSKTASGNRASQSPSQSSNGSGVNGNGDVAPSLPPFQSLSSPAQKRSKQSASVQPSRSGHLTEKSQHQKRGNLKRKRESKEVEKTAFDQSPHKKENAEVEREGKRSESGISWKWGPGATSQMAIKFYDAIQHIPRQGKTRSAKEKEPERVTSFRVQPNVLASPPSESLENNEAV